MGTLNNMVNDNNTVTVEWPNFGQALGHDMWQFCMAPEYSDVTIRTKEGHEIPGHRIILSVCSPYFSDLFKTNRTAAPIVCLSDIRFDIMKKILKLIYSGAVVVRACEMGSFVKAAQYLRLQGFEHIDSPCTVNDIFGPVPPNKRSFSLKLKRIVEDDLFAMNTTTTANDKHDDKKANPSTTTNGDNLHGENNGCISSDSSDDAGEEYGNGNGAIITDGGDADGENNVSNSIEQPAKRFTLSSSSSSSSECGPLDIATEDEHSDAPVDND